jgi:chromosome partitioning protein
MRLAVLNQKGGSGKTTIATHLARAWQLAGLDVVLIDSDPQGSARDWAAVRPDQPVPVVGIDRPTIDRDVRALGRRDRVVIDGAPQAADLAASAIRAADLVLIPVQPSPYDIWAAADLVALVKARQAIADGRPRAAFVVSRVIRATRLSAEVAEALEEHGLPVLPTRIHQRIAYPTSAAAGSTVLDTEPHGDAAAEMRALMRAIDDMLSHIHTPTETHR